ncbi:MAG TPA: 4Fe-4S dicluster domain-containing protein [Lachnospiraceae bacterium]|nr:4Fe-4S dicluster domain-containing protein [Lachnospiraceae bacterium]
MRQKIRKLLLLISLLLFPVTMWYFSPAIISMAMAEHVMNGSFFVFMAMLLLSPILSRVFCGFLCPAGGLQACLVSVNDKPSKQGKRNAIKYVIFTVWIVALIILYCLGKGKAKIDFFYMTDHGVSVTGVYNYITYYGVLLILVLPAILHGKHATCHYICWMAPFMILGSKVGRLLHLPQLHVEADKDKCISCKKCNSVCPMGLDVENMVHKQRGCIHTECIQCGSCVDDCPKNVLTYTMKSIKTPEK